MPRYVLSQPPKAVGHEKLVKRLAQELKSPGEGAQPLILEQIIESTGSRHVHVVWDRWQEIPDEQRSAIIEEAYRQAEGPQRAAEITLASGVTPPEALVLGLLPFKLVSIRQRDDAKPTLAAYKKAITGEVAATLLGPKAEELRYPRLEDAEAAKRRLEKTLPASQWTIVQEVAFEP
jgi:hypothetical protein